MKNYIPFTHETSIELLEPAHDVPSCFDVFIEYEYFPITNRLAIADFSARYQPTKLEVIDAVLLHRIKRFLIEYTTRAHSALIHNIHNAHEQ